jgi:hypothetical protein
MGQPVPLHDDALVELAKAGDLGVIVVEYIKREAAKKVTAINVLEKTNAYSPAFATAQRTLVNSEEALNITEAQQGVANCVNRFVSDFCGAHYNTTDSAVVEHYRLQRDSAKRVVGSSQVDALTALVGFKSSLFDTVPELADELDHMVTDPAKYMLATATEEDRRQVHASIETLMELEVARIQAEVKTKLTPAVVDSTTDAGLANLITLRRNEISSILGKTPAVGLDAFTELSALSRFGGGAGAYKLCNLATRGAGGYEGACVTDKYVGSVGYDAERCTAVCQCGSMGARALGGGCNATLGKMCVCGKCQGTMAMGNIAGSAASRRRELLQAATPSADEQTLAKLSELQTSTAALEASLAAVKAAQATSIAAERAHHDSTALSDSITAGFSSITASVDSLSTIITGVAPAAAKATERATTIESRVARLASQGTDRLALLKDSLTANNNNVEVAYKAGYASAASRDAMVRKTTLKCMAGPHKLNAVQLTHSLKGAWFQPLDLKCDILVPKFAFKWVDLWPLQCGG